MTVLGGHKVLEETQGVSEILLLNSLLIVKKEDYIAHGTGSPTDSWGPFPTPHPPLPVLVAAKLQMMQSGGQGVRL